MAFTFPIDNLEWHGGAIYLAQIATGAGYAMPNDYATWNIALTPSDGVSLECTVESEQIYCDQTAGAIDNIMKLTSAVVTVTMMKSTASDIAIALGLDITDAADYTTTGATESSVWLASNAVTEKQAMFGGVKSNTYYDLLFDKPQTHDITKIIGFRLPKAIASGGINWAFKHGESDYYEMKFMGLAIDSAMVGGALLPAAYLGQSVIIRES